MSDTPRTDAIVAIASIEDRYIPLRDLARQLELNLSAVDAALRQRDKDVLNYLAANEALKVVNSELFKALSLLLGVAEASIHDPLYDDEAAAMDFARKAIGNTRMLADQCNALRKELADPVCWVIAVEEYGKMVVYGPQYSSKASAEYDARLPTRRNGKAEVWACYLSS